MRHYLKQPLSYDNIIVILKSRGLLIPDVAKAKQQLQKIGYYRLSAYAIPFEMCGTNGVRSHQFMADSTFEHIYNLYSFDCELRTLVLSAIQDIEVALRSAFANNLALIARDAHAYLLPQFFEHIKHKENMSALLQEIERSRDPHIDHYRNTYLTPSSPPIWSVTEVMSLGSLSKWVYSLRAASNMNAKADIASFLGFQRYDFLDSFLMLLTITRNICAHHARLFNRLFPARIKIKSAPNTLQSVLSTSAQGDLNNKKKLYNILVLIGYVLEHIDIQCKWKQQLKSSIDVHLGINFNEKHLQQILQTMGFPQDWEDMTFWNE